MSNLTVIGHNDGRLDLEEAIALYKNPWGEIVKVELEIASDDELTERLREQQLSRVKAFPEGQRATINSDTGELCGTIYSLLISSSQLPEINGWNHLTGYGSGKTHNPNGDCLVCYAVQTNGKESGAATALLTAQKELAHRLRKRLFVFTRPNGLRAYATNQRWPLDGPGNIVKYLDAKIEGMRIPYDGVSFHLRRGAVLAPLLKDGKPFLANSRLGDVNSLGFNVLMEYAVR